MISQQAQSVIRVLLGALLGFELLNWVGVFSISSDPIWIGLVATSGGVLLAAEVLYSLGKRLQLPHVSPIAIVAPLVAVGIDALGNMMNLYWSVYNFDKLMHFASGIAAATALFYIFHIVFERKQIYNAWWSVYAAVTTTSFLGVGFEVIEYVSDRVIGKSFWLGTGADTVTDLIMNILGAGTAVLVIRLMTVDSSASAFRSHFPLAWHRYTKSNVEN